MKFLRKSASFSGTIGKRGSRIRLLGIHASGFDREQGQLDLLNPQSQERWAKALAAADKLRDRFGESAISLASGMKGRYHERVHENPAGFAGQDPGRNRTGGDSSSRSPKPSAAERPNT